MIPAPQPNLHTFMSVHGLRCTAHTRTHSAHYSSTTTIADKSISLAVPHSCTTFHHHTAHYIIYHKVK